MPTVRYTSEGGRYRTAGVTFESGDTHEVPDGKAEYLVEEVGDFEYAEDAGTTGDADEPVDDDVHVEDGPPDDNADNSAPESEDGDEGDGDGGEFDIDAWLDHDYQERADRVNAGEVDDHLDQIAEEETSDTVLDAIGVRRAELAEE